MKLRRTAGGRRDPQRWRSTGDALQWTEIGDGGATPSGEERQRLTWRRRRPLAEKDNSSTIPTSINQDEN
jgi:hypothetical protein